MRLKSIIPDEVISKGFAVVYVNGHRAQLASEIEEGDKVEILLKDGSVCFEAVNVIRHKKL